MGKTKEPTLEAYRKEWEDGLVEGLLEVLKDPSLFDEWTLLSKAELEWTKEAWEQLAAESPEYDSFRMSTTRRNRYRNLKSRTKSKILRATLDLARVQWIHREFSDRAFEEMMPLEALYIIVLTHTFRFGYSAAAIFALAVENGLRLNAIKDGEGQELVEFQVPIISRLSNERIAKIEQDTVTRAFERVAAQMASERNEG